LGVRAELPEILEMLVVELEDLLGLLAEDVGH
jgi:hypothetical protein